MKIEVGKYYLDEYGKIEGPMKAYDGSRGEYYITTECDDRVWCSNGQYYGIEGEGFNLVKEAFTSPIQVVTKKEFVPGVYGIVNVSKVSKPTLCPKARDYSSQELRQAAKVFGELADYMDEQK